VATRSVLGAILLVAILAGPALADTILGTTGDLHDSSPKTEQAWLQTLVGAGTTLSFITDVQKPAGADGKQLTNYNPGFAWDYAIVKWADNWTAYLDSAPDNLLSAGPFSNGISHVDFWKTGGSVSVPEPSALILLGVGLAVAVPFVRSRRARA
jgi:hypothetical protein